MLLRLDPVVGSFDTEKRTPAETRKGSTVFQCEKSSRVRAARRIEWRETGED